MTINTTAVVFGKVAHVQGKKNLYHLYVKSTISACASGTKQDDLHLIQAYIATPTRADRRCYSQSLFILEMFHMNKREDLVFKILSLIQMST